MLQISPIAERIHNVDKSILICGVLFFLFQHGLFQLVETITGGGLSTNMSYPVDTNGSLIVAFDISDSLQAMAFGDSSGKYFASEI